MKATILDLRRRMKDVLLVFDRSESVSIYYRGKEKAILSLSLKRTKKPVEDHSAFGMWRDRKDMTDLAATAVEHHLTLRTANKKRYSAVNELDLRAFQPRSDG